MPKITKCGIFVKYNAKKSLKSFKTLHFRVLADASKLTTPANKEGKYPVTAPTKGASRKGRPFCCRGHKRA
jgi:hypothetical protein